MKLLNELTESGLRFSKTPYERRGVLLSNQVSLILLALSSMLFFVYWWWFGFTVVAKIIPITCIMYVIVIACNKIGFITFSRLCISLYLTFVVMAISIYAKIQSYPNQELFSYLTYRFLILGSCVIPTVIFSFREKALLFLATFIDLALLMAYDPIHAAFGVGFQINSYSGDYYFTNIIVFITYWILIGAVLFLKRNAEKNEDDNYRLIQELGEKQHQIQTQANELKRANELIAKQNEALESDLFERNEDLKETNEELIKNNNELQQFSYAVSHNLRGPVASLLGLTGLLKNEVLDEGNKEIIERIEASTKNLDGIISDLNTITNIRHIIFQVKQKVNLNQVIAEIKSTFNEEIDKFGVSIRCEFKDCPEVYSIKPMLHSILYNLISNSIKYQSIERKPVIEIKSQLVGDYFILTLQDNGLGIDLDRDKENLFKLFKRFHIHIEGKGLGLYLIKTQAEALGGKVEVESQVNEFTRFKIYIKVPQNVQEQILLDDDYAKIFYDATINSTGVIWKKVVSHEEYKKVYNKCLEFLRIYATPNWISDQLHQGAADPTDIEWLLKFIVPDAALHGLRSAALIVHDQKDRQQVGFLIKKLAQLNVQGQSFYSYQEARNWIAQRNTDK